MTRLSYRHSAQRLMFATALPLGLLAAGATSVYAGSVTVTGANGANGGATGYYATPGGNGGSAPATASTPDPSNIATAQGGAGGRGGGWSFGYCLQHNFWVCRYPGRGGAGGPATATATATTSIHTGAASASAISTGGVGGSGGFGYPQGGHGGTGGTGTSTATASTGNGSASATATSTGGTGGNGGPAPFLTSYGPQGFGGYAAAAASASSASSGQVQATASAFGGPVGAGKPPASSGWAYASSSAKNQSGEVLTTGTAPNAGSASVLTKADIGTGNATLATLVGGQVVSNAVLTPAGPDLGIGAMAAAYGGPGETPMLQYTATAAFDFTTPNREALDLDLKLPPISFAGIGFDSLELQVAVVGGSTLTKNFSSLTAAEAFFTGPSVGLGTVAAGSQSVSLTYDLTYNPGTLAQAGDGFGFTYDIRDPPATAFDFAAASPIAGIPEPSTWTMMLVGFAVLASAGLRRRKPSMTVCGPGQDGRAD